METTVRANDWHDPRWLAGAHEWIASRLDAAATGPIEEVRVRPWSVTHRVATAAGPRWFKANTTGCAYEAALADALGRWHPGSVLAPLAVDTGRGWLLTADAGPTLREVLGDDREKRVSTWASMLQAYAVLQRALAPRATALLALGVPDVRVATLPAHRESLLPALPPGGVADVLAAPLHRWCEELAADGIPASLQHDDLSDSNVFPDGPTGFRFFDWGDASVSHPFGTLLAALSTAAWFLGLDTGDAALLRLRDAYLEPWSDLASPAALRRSASLACRVGRISKALAWHRALRDAALPVDDDFRTAVPDWLAELPADPIV